MGRATNKPSPVRVHQPSSNDQRRDADKQCVRMLKTRYCEIDQYEIYWRCTLWTKLMQQPDDGLFFRTPGFMSAIVTNFLIPCKLPKAGIARSRSY